MTDESDPASGEPRVADDERLASALADLEVERESAHGGARAALTRRINALRKRLGIEED